MKRRIFAVLIGCMLCALTACSNVPEPEYSSDEIFDVGMWVGVPDKNYVYDEDGNKLSESAIDDATFLSYYQDVADAGINIAFPGYAVMHDGGGSYDGSYNMRALAAAEEVGIRHIIADDTLRTYLMTAKTLINAGTLTFDAAVERVKEMIQPYRKYESLYGFMIRDEPNTTLFDAIGYGETIFKAAAPDLMYYVNLFPVIAGPELMGGGASVNYNSYISQYMEKVDTDYLSYDHYPLYMRGTETSLEASFLYNMDFLKTKIAEEGKDRRLWTFLQSIDFNANRSLTSKGDAAFQAYSFLAFGGDGIQWFCYACPPPYDGATYFGEALVDRDMQKTDVYNYVSAVNSDIQFLMQYYKNFEWQGFMVNNVNGGEGNFDYISESNNICNSDTLSAIDSSDDLLVGCFKDKEGREGFMAVNFTDPYDGLSNTVTLTLKDKTRAIVVKNGVKTVEKVNGGKLTFEMNPGEGWFVIPY